MKHINEYSKFGIIYHKEESDFMNESVNGILIDMIDEGFTIKSEIMAIPNSITNIIIRYDRRDNRNLHDTTPKKIGDYKDVFETLNDFLKEYKYDFFHISINGKWLCDNRDRGIQFCRKSFNEIWDIIYTDGPFRSMVLEVFKR